MDYSLQGNRKAEEGKTHLDRDAQFRYLNAHIRQALAQQRPIVSADTKKNELIGSFENNGR
jgi:hypothetical protein